MPTKCNLLIHLVIILIEISQYQLGTHEFTMSIHIPNNNKY